MATNDLNVSIGAEIGGLQRGLKQADADLSKFDAKIKNIGKLGSQFKSIGKKMSIGLSLPLIALGGTAVNTFAKFEQGMASVQAISGATSKEFKALKDNAEDLGATTKFAASEVAGLQLNLAKLGFKPGQITESTGAILDLAQATGEDLANSASVAAGVMKAFGISTAETGRVADVMAKSFSSSSLDLNKFSVAMGRVAPDARLAGESIESTTASLSVLIDQNIDASTAATGLRNIFQQLAKSGMTMADAFDVINSASNKSKKAQELFGRTSSATAVILAENADAAKEFTKEYKNAAGSAKAMAKIMDNTSSGAMARLKSAFESLQISLGEELAPTINKIADFLGGLASKFKDLSPQMKKTVIVIGGIVAAAGPLLVIVGSIGAALPAVVAGFAALNTVILANPIGALVIGVSALTAALYLFTRQTNEAAIVSKTLTEVQDTAAKSIARERVEIDSLLKVAKDETRSKKDRQIALDKINKIYPSYIDNIELDEINTKKATRANEEYIKSINKRALEQAALDKKTELFAKKIEKTTERLSKPVLSSDKLWSFFGVESQHFDGIDDFNKHIDKLRESGKANEGLITALTEAYKGQIKKREDDISAIDAQIDSLDQYINVVDKVIAKEKQADEGVSFGKREGTPIRQAVTPVISKPEQGSSFSDSILKENDKIDNAFEKRAELMTAAQLNAVELSMNINEAFRDIASYGVADSISNTMDSIGQAIANGGDVISAIGQSLLGSFGKFLSNMGDMLIKYGTLAVAKGKLDIAIATGGPFAIGAGIAAIAVGAALKIAGAAIGSAAKSGFGGASGGGGGSYSGTGDVGGDNTMPAGNASGGSMQDGRVVFEIEGRKLVGVLSRTLDRNKRLGTEIGL